MDRVSKVERDCASAGGQSRVSGAQGARRRPRRRVETGEMTQMSDRFRVPPPGGLDFVGLGAMVQLDPGVVPFRLAHRWREAERRAASAEGRARRWVDHSRQDRR
jgi:hypothetical protein